MREDFSLYVHELVDKPRESSERMNNSTFWHSYSLTDYRRTTGVPCANEPVTTPLFYHSYILT
jgi:hypothetical protein